METNVRDLSSFEQEAVRFAGSLVPKKEGAVLVTLSGELGAGKTAFTKAAARAFGVEEVVNSPTFVLEKIYVLVNQAFKRLVHIDAYRLESGKELASLGFDELMKDIENLILLEWPENVKDALPLPEKTVTISVHDDGSRTIFYG